MTVKVTTASRLVGASASRAQVAARKGEHEGNVRKLLPTKEVEEAEEAVTELAEAVPVLGANEAICWDFDSDNTIKTAGETKRADLLSLLD